MNIPPVFSLKLWKLSAALVLLATLAACGFQLRGTANWPFKTLYIGLPDNSQLGNELRRNIRNGTTTQLVEDPKQAEAIFELINEYREKVVLTLNAAGRVREYELRYQITFRVHNGKGQEWLPATTFKQKRVQTYDETVVLAKDNEDVILYKDMQHDMVDYILRRLNAAKLAEQ